jgi:hypothetical protein
MGNIMNIELVKDHYQNKFPKDNDIKLDKEIPKNDNFKKLKDKDVRTLLEILIEI